MAGGHIVGAGSIDGRGRARCGHGQHGWWQACPDIGAPGYDPFGPDGANFNLIIGNAAIDPVSGSVPHRAYLCEIRRLT
ncbi:MAG: hypothetical protein HY870_07260 [Chloroflexi bacterium]|nr:hypothetical protein [Chloroflexota bacterium]